MKAFTLPCWYSCGILPYSMHFVLTLRVHHRLEFGVIRSGVAWQFTTVMRVATIYSASCSMSIAVQLSLRVSFPAVARRHFWAASFLLSSYITLTIHPVTFWLVSMLVAIPSGPTRLHSITVSFDDDDSSSSLTYVTSVPTSVVVYIKSMMAVGFLWARWLTLSGSLFNIKLMTSTCCSSPVSSLPSQLYTFHCGPLVLKSPKRISLASMTLYNSMPTTAVLIVLISTLVYPWSGWRWFPYTLTILVLLFFLPPLSSSSHTFSTLIYGWLMISVFASTMILFLMVPTISIVTRCSFHSSTVLDRLS